MVRTSLALALALCVTPTVPGQSLLPPAPVPASPAPPPSSPPPPPELMAPVPDGAQSPPGAFLPPPAPLAPPPASPFGSGGLPGDPGPLPPAVAPTYPRVGFFGAFDLGLLAPNFHQNLVAPVTVAGFTQPVSLPTACLEWVGAPRVELGYWFPEGIGGVAARYESIVSTGTATLTGFDPTGDASLRSLVNVNVLDVDYLSKPIPFADFWDVQWRAGGRFNAIYFSSRAAGPVVEERVSNNFVGGGPHGGVGVNRALTAVPGLSAFGRLDGAVVIGNVSQNFEQVWNFGPGGQYGGATHVSATRASPVLAFRTGLSYLPRGDSGWMRFAGGYEIEQWWGIGNVGSSSANFQAQGLFFRGEFRY